MSPQKFLFCVRRVVGSYLQSLFLCTCVCNSCESIQCSSIVFNKKKTIIGVKQILRNIVWAMTIYLFDSNGVCLFQSIIQSIPIAVNTIVEHILCLLLISFSFFRMFIDVFFLPPSHTNGSFNHSVRRSIVPIALIISRLARSNQQSNCFYLNLYYIIGVCPVHIIHMTFCRRISMSMILPNSHAQLHIVSLYFQRNTTTTEIFILQFDLTS